MRLLRSGCIIREKILKMMDLALFIVWEYSQVCLNVDISVRRSRLVNTH